MLILILLMFIEICECDLYVHILGVIRGRFWSNFTLFVDNQLCFFLNNIWLRYYNVIK